MALRISQIGNYQFFTQNGAPFVGSKLFTYAEGTTTKVDTFTDILGTAKHTNPIVMNAMGFPPAPIFLDLAKRYKFVLANPTDTDPPTSSLYTWDGVTVGVQIDVASASSEWILGPFPTYISGTSFSIPGDFTTTLSIGQRVRLTLGATLFLGTISALSFGSGVTTLTIINDIGPLDPGISEFFYSFLSSNNGSVPDVYFANLTTNFVGPVVVPPTEPFDLLPAGLITEYAGAIAPAGWLFTFGQSLLRTDFPALFASLGTAFGSVDGTHFSLPDLRGSFPLGKDNMGGTPSGRVTSASVGGVNAITLGGRGGEQVHTLTIAEMPAHDHDSRVGGVGSGQNNGTFQDQATISPFKTALTGGGGAHNTMPPWLSLNYIIRAY